MNDEVTLSSINQEVAQKESLLARLDKTIAERILTLNNLRNEKATISESFETTFNSQAVQLRERVREAQAKTDRFIKTHDQWLNTLAIKDQENKRRSEENSILRDKLEKLEDQLLLQQADLSLNFSSLNASLKEMNLREKTLKEDIDRLNKVKIILERSAKDLDRNSSDWVAFREKQRKILDEEWHLLGLEKAMAADERKGYFDAIKEIRAEKENIASQWEQLIRAKQVLDLQCKSCNFCKKHE